MHKITTTVMTRAEAIDKLAAYFAEEQLRIQPLEDIAVFGRTGFSEYSNAELLEMLHVWSVLSEEDGKILIYDRDLDISQRSAQDRLEHLSVAVKKAMELLRNNSVARKVLAEAMGELEPEKE